MKGLLLVCMFAAVVFVNGAAAAGEPIRLADKSPLMGIYYFTHWWEPWHSSDEKILEDFKRLKKMGINTVFLDSEWSQMIDRNWHWLDRGHKLAKQAGIQILPWLSLKVWVDVSDPDRSAIIKDMYGADLEVGTGIDGGRGRTKPYDPGVIEAGTKYGLDYIGRYIDDGALLRVMHDGKPCPVVALTVELEWSGSYDPVTQQMFRLWLRGRYIQDIKKLNKVWGTSFTAFDQIDLTDQKVFDLGNHHGGKAKHPNAVEDQIEFRAQVMDNGLSEIKRRLRQKYPDLLIATELPYQFNCEHPHGRSYRINTASNPSSTNHADILVIRATDTLTPNEEKFLLNYRKGTDQKIVLTYRTHPQWGRELVKGDRTYADMDRRYALQAARLADGFGFYSWNEMVDVHAVADPNPPFNPDQAVTAKESAATIRALETMVGTYLKSIGR